MPVANDAFSNHGQTSLVEGGILEEEEHRDSLLQEGVSQHLKSLQVHAKQRLAGGQRLCNVGDGRCRDTDGVQYRLHHVQLVLGLYQILAYQESRADYCNNKIIACFWKKDYAIIRSYTIVSFELARIEVKLPHEQFLVVEAIKIFRSLKNRSNGYV